MKTSVKWKSTGVDSANRRPGGRPGWKRQWSTSTSRKCSGWSTSTSRKSSGWSTSTSRVAIAQWSTSTSWKRQWSTSTSRKAQSGRRRRRNDSVVDRRRCWRQADVFITPVESTMCASAFDHTVFSLRIDLRKPLGSFYHK